MRQLTVLLSALLCLGGASHALAADSPHAGNHKAHGEGAHQPHPAMDDAAYVQMMLMHHQDGVDMAQVAVERATRPEVKQFATRLIDDQNKDIEELRALEKKLPPSHGHSMDQAQMDAMKERVRSASAPEFDRAFLDTMIKHHQQAIAMSEHPSHFKSLEVKAFAQKTVQQQGKDVQEMNRMRNT